MSHVLRQVQCYVYAQHCSLSEFRLEQKRGR
jgi:hypothetical protein